MAMGTRKQREKQEDIWIAHTELASAPGHPFYQRLNELLEAESFDEFVEGRCAKFYAAKYGRPSLTPGIYFRSLLIGYFEGIGATGILTATGFMVEVDHQSRESILSSSTQLICRGLRSGEDGAYAEFARNAWGKDSVQAQPARIDWLYRENPNSLGREKDLLVMFDGPAIVGAHHLMRIPWCIRGHRTIVPSFHDLYVLPSHRKGEGTQLVLAALAGEANAALFGLSGLSDQIYARMRVPMVRLIWLNKWRSIALGAFQHVAYRLGRRLTQLRGDLLAREDQIDGFEILQTHRPTREHLELALRIVPAEAIYPDWDPPSYSWRFFDDLGPDNILVVASKAGATAGRAVISVGTRRGVGVARIVDFVANDAACRKALVTAIERIFGEIRVPFTTAVTSSDQVAQSLLQQGWMRRKEAPRARWFSRKPGFRAEETLVCGGAWDFGCDLHMERQ
jgi:hypothetical protein